MCAVLKVLWVTETAAKGLSIHFQDATAHSAQGGRGSKALNDIRDSGHRFKKVFGEFMQKVEFVRSIGLP